MSPFIWHLVATTAGSPAALSLVIMTGTLFLEDATSVVVGVLVADGIIPFNVGILSLYGGVVLGDLAFYWIGRIAGNHKRLARYVDHELTAPARAWLETRFVLTVFSARFIPGTRMATYGGSGFFRLPFSTFAGTAIAATSVWITFLFSAAYWFGNATTKWLGPVRWGIAFVFLLALFLIGRQNIRRRRAEYAKKEDRRPAL